MSTPAIKAPGVPWSIEDLEDWPEDGSKQEIIDGSLHVTPSPAISHAYVILRLRRLLDNRLPADLVAVERVGLRGPDTDTLEPDLSVVPETSLQAGGRLLDPTHVLLAVEVVSPSSRAHDRVTKPNFYRDWGVQAYLVVDPERRQLMLWPWRVSRTAVVDQVVSLDLDGTMVTIEAAALLD